MAWWSKNKIVGMLVSAMLALEHIYKANPPKREKIVKVDQKDVKNNGELNEK